MTNTTKLLLFSTATLALTTNSLGDTTVHTLTPIPEATVIVVHDEVEVEYLPSVIVEVVHDEVEINGQREG